MWNILRLLLPALIPSWRFFRSVEPSPRIQWALVQAAFPATPDWNEASTRPGRLTGWQTLGRLFWNAEWNEALYMVSCAERIQQSPVRHGIEAIAGRVASEIRRKLPDAPADASFRFRLVFVRRTSEGLVSEEVFVSDLLALPGGQAA